MGRQANPKYDSLYRAIVRNYESDNGDRVRVRLKQADDWKPVLSALIYRVERDLDPRHKVRVSRTKKGSAEFWLE